MGRSRIEVRTGPDRTLWCVRLALALFCCALSPAQTAPASTSTEASFPAGYVGAETCAGCHDEVVKKFDKNPHHALDNTKSKWRKWEGRACESCHGPGEKHANSADPKDIQNPSKLKPVQADLICLSCHRNQATHVGRLQNGHARGEVGCTACHDIHATGADSSAVRLKQTAKVNQLCSSCHVDVWAAFQKPNHHRVPEGAMACTACHNPHGGFLRANNRMSNGNEPGCLSCHSDKRGPFVFEHAPVRSEPCSTCHEPHGSSNPRMLTRHEVSSQCLECHANLLTPTPNTVAGGIPPAFHDLRQARYRQCTICHQKIHGSNANRSLMR